MIKKLETAAARGAIVAMIATLLMVLFMNLSTLWAANRIAQGELVRSGFFSALVGSGSMEPTISTMDMLVVMGSDSYQEGDVITYISPQGSLVTHRLIEIAGSEFVAQGDANNIPDAPFDRQRVVGKVVFTLHGTGAALAALSTPKGGGLALCMVILIWLIGHIGKRDEGDAR